MPNAVKANFELYVSIFVQVQYFVSSDSNMWFSMGFFFGLRVPSCLGLGVFEVNSKVS